MKGWLDNFGKADNANDSNVSLPEGFVGLGYDTKGRNYSPAWGGQFEYGGEIAQRGKKIDQILNANKNLDWVKGLYDPSYGSIQIPGQEGRSTHFMESADRRVYPTIRKIDGELIYLGDDAYDYADSTKSYIEFPTDKKAQKFAKNYKRGTGVLDFQHGGSIPGSVGFTYARVAGAAPSKGKYAKKTMASAQNGIIADKIAGLELKMSPEYQRLKYLQSLPQLRQAPGRGEELVREGLATADIATDLMQVGNFIPHPMAQGVGKAGNILGSGVDLVQAAMSARQGNYLDAAINLGSVGLAGGLAANTFRRNSKYLQPGQPLYALSPQAFGSLSRTNYIEPFRKVGKMTDKNLLANRALLGLIGAETVYDAIPQKEYGGNILFAQNGEEDIKTIDLPEIVVTPYDEQYPFYQSLSEEEKKYINDKGPIGRGIRAIATTGKKGQTAKDISKLVKDVEKFGYEATGIPGTIRFSDDPVGKLTGTGKTLLDLGLTASPLAISLGGVNPITGQQMFNEQNLQGAFDTLDALGMATGAMTVLKQPVQQALKTSGKFLTTQTPLKNTYKINPFAVKEPDVILTRAQKPGQTDELRRLAELESKKASGNLDFMEKYEYNQILNSGVSQPGYGRWFGSDPGQLGYYTSPNIQDRRGYEGFSEILKLRLPGKEAKNFNVGTNPVEGAFPSYAPSKEFILPQDLVFSSESFIPNAPYGKPGSLDNFIRTVDAEQRIANTPDWLRGYPSVANKPSILVDNIKEARKNIVNRSITPIGYDPFTVAAAPLELITPNALKFKPKTYATKNRFDSWRLYNGLDPEFDTFSKNPDGTLAINDFRLGKDDLEEIVNNPKESFGTTEIRREFNFGGVHGNGWITKGVDEEGRKFIDFTDTWDLQPFAAFSKLPERIRNFEVSSLSGGKPFDLKNRIYYDDKGNFFDHSGNKLVEEVQHFPKGVAKENEAADIPMLSTPNVVGTKQTDVLKDWNNATNHKFIKGGLTSGIGVASGASYLAARAAKKRLKEDEKKGDDTVKEFQNGGEMKFYQNGLDWKPKSMQDGGTEKISINDPRYPELYKNRQVGAYYDGAYSLPDLDEVTVTAPRSYTMDSLRDFTTAALYGAPATAMNLSMVPQATMTEGIEALRGKPYDFSNAGPNLGYFGSNQRDLSQTMGYENPQGFLQKATNFGLSMVDPLNLVGVNVIAKTIPTQAIKSSVINTKNNLSRAIKGTGSFVDQVKGEVLQGKANRESIKIGNDWLQNWIDNPATRQKIDADIDRAIALKGPDATIDDLNYLELVRNQSKDFVPNSKEYSLYDQLNDNIDQYLRLSNTKLKPIHGKNMGISLMHSVDPQTRELIAKGLVPADEKYGSFISRNTSIPQVERQYTAIHEGTHDWLPEEVVKKLGIRNIALKNINPEAKQYLLDIEAGLKDQLTKEQKYLGYLADPTEQHARIMELRANLGLKPEDVVDEDLAKEIIKKIENRETPVDRRFLKVIDSNPLKLAERFNRFWAVPAVGAVVGSQAVDQQKNGGSVKNNKNPMQRFQEGGQLNFNPLTNEYELPEFVVEGKDERIKNAMSQGMANFYGHVGELMGAPQKEMMQLITGKEQTPSQAFGFQNTGGWLDSPTSFGKNLLNTGLDFGLDPLNAVGVGLADDVFKLGIKNVGKNLTENLGKGIGKRAISQAPSPQMMANGLSSQIANAANDLGIFTGKSAKSNPEKHLQAFNKKKQEILESLNTPEGRRRLQLGIDNNPFQTGLTPDDVIKHFEDLKFVTEKPDMEKILNFQIPKLNSDGTVKMIPLKPYDAFSYNPKGFSNPESVVAIGEGYTALDALNLLEHEMTHWFQRGMPLNKVDDELAKLDLMPDEELIKRQPKSKVKDFFGRLNPFSEKELGETNFEKALSTRKNPKTGKPFTPEEIKRGEGLVDYKDYFLTGSDNLEKATHASEIRSSLMQKGIIKNRYDEITPEMLEEHYKQYNKIKGDKYTLRLYEIIKPTMKNFSHIANALNNLPALTLPVAGGAAAVGSGLQNQQPVQKQKNGGITKDNLGYWNPDNWGKPVEIDSNNITMEGVYEPLLGISDTGDTKLMKPGKNYKFKGKKVTEFPVAELGINQLDAQPMKKLNQLLNFTNNPDKDNWLDKYN